MADGEFTPFSPLLIGIAIVTGRAVTIAIPIKRGLKVCFYYPFDGKNLVTIAIPIKRGLKATTDPPTIGDIVSYNCYPD